MQIARPASSIALTLCLFATTLSSAVQAQVFHYRIWNDGGSAYCASDANCLMAVVKATVEFAQNGNTFGEGTHRRIQTSCPDGESLGESCSERVSGPTIDPLDTYHYYLVYCCDGAVTSADGIGETPELAAISAGIAFVEEDCGEEKYILGGGPEEPDLGDYECRTSKCFVPCRPTCCIKVCSPQQSCKPRCFRRGGILRRLFRR